MYDLKTEGITYKKKVFWIEKEILRSVTTNVTYITPLKLK